MSKGKWYSNEEDKKIEALYYEGLSFKEIAYALGRPDGAAIRKRAVLVGIHVPTSHRTSVSEKRIKYLYSCGMLPTAIHRSTGAGYKRVLKVLGLKQPGRKLNNPSNRGT